MVRSVESGNERFSAPFEFKFDYGVLIVSSTKTEVSISVCSSEEGGTVIDGGEVVVGYFGLTSDTSLVAE